ncbi:DUF4350 domain-containing protein [Agromyces soli]
MSAPAPIAPHPPASTVEASPGPGASAPAVAGSRVETATVRGGLRRWRIWIVLGALALVGAVALAAIQGGARSSGQPLGADNAAPAGAKALVEVLRAQGVEVEPVASLDGALHGADDGATVLVYDAMGLLDPAGISELAGSAERLVVVAPDFAQLAELDAGVRLAGVASGPLADPDCVLPSARRAGALSDGQRLLSLDQGALDTGWSGCFPDEGGGFALVTGPSDGGRITLVGATTAFANETVDEAGNAALALGLTGERERLVWYLPGFDDLDPESAPSMGELTPGWVGPAVVLSIVVAVVAGVWRGRRFGPLVVEDLPVEVPASETREGRARLYARSSVRTHSIDQLRIGAVTRIGAVLRLPRAASVSEVVVAASAATARDPRAVAHVLVDALPANDAELVALARALAELEDAVRRSVRPDATGIHDPTRAAGPAPTQSSDPSGRRP